jgi:thiosulfate dehydrogenase
MNKKSHSLFVAAILVASTLFIPGTSSAEEVVSSIARGGLLYDKWFKVTGAEKPKDTHKAWPASNTKKSGDVTWRCKSCHGWDLKGKDGAYSSGSYLTGIKGLEAMANVDTAKIIAIFKDDTHGYGDMMSAEDYQDLANFVSLGQYDMSKYIDYATKTSKGDAAKGEAYYNTVCAKCHGKDGTLPKDMEKTVGALVNSNPWEIMHKIMEGQPAEDMPAMRAFGPQVSADILAYSKTLPTKR